MPAHIQRLKGAKRIFAFVVYGDAHHIEMFACKVFPYLLNIRHFCLAGTTPRSPVIEQDILPLANVIREADITSIKIALLYQIIREHLTGSRSAL